MAKRVALHDLTRVMNANGWRRTEGGKQHNYHLEQPGSDTESESESEEKGSVLTEDPSLFSEEPTLFTLYQELTLDCGSGVTKTLRAGRVTSKAHGRVTGASRRADRHVFEQEPACPGPIQVPVSKDIDNELARIFRNQRATLDFEDEDTFEPLMCAEYAPDVFAHMHALELRLRPDPQYMQQQHEIKWYMRATLIDWLVQVHERFRLLPETLYLAVNYVDRFLSKRRVSLSRFQLVGSVALFVAAKYEEISCPSLKEIVHILEYVYSEDDIIRAERFMIAVLEFDMGWPGPMSFLRRTSKADDYDFETRTLAKYLLELTLMDIRFVALLPSWLAAGAHFLARVMLGKGGWSAAHVFYLGYTAEQLVPFANCVVDVCRDGRLHHSAIFQKYGGSSFRRASLFVEEWVGQLEAEVASDGE